MNEEQFNKLEGWFDYPEALAMKKALDHVKDLDGVIVEAGSFKGKSTAWIASNTTSNVYAIDPFKWVKHCHKDFLKQTAGYNNIVCIKKDAVKYATTFKNKKENIKLLFIDCDHTYSLTKSIYELYVPFVVPGGIILFHDCSIINYVLPETEGNEPIYGDVHRGWFGPTRVLQEVRQTYKPWDGQLSLHGIIKQHKEINWHPV